MQTCTQSTVCLCSWQLKEVGEFITPRDTTCFVLCITQCECANLYLVVFIPVENSWDTNSFYDSFVGLWWNPIIQCECASQKKLIVCWLHTSWEFLTKKIQNSFMIVWLLYDEGLSYNVTVQLCIINTVSSIHTSWESITKKTQSSFIVVSLHLLSLCHTMWLCNDVQWTQFVMIIPVENYFTTKIEWGVLCADFIWAYVSHTWSMFNWNDVCIFGLFSSELYKHTTQMYVFLYSHRLNTFVQAILTDLYLMHTK